VKTIAVCAAQVPFFRGGAEAHVQGLVDNLRVRGFEVELINIPYKWYPREQLLKSIDIWEMLDLSESNGKSIDLAITTKFPSYFVRHPRKVLWLIHQYRQIYDLFGTEFSEFDPSDKAHMVFRNKLIERDSQALKSYKHIFTNAGNTAARLKQYNGIPAQPLYHPPPLAGRYYTHKYEGFILSVGRLDKLKRVDLLLRALSSGCPDITCKIAGTGPEEPLLKALTEKLGLESRVEFLGYVPDDRLLQLYADCAAVYFAPLDEDYGYITLEAFLSRKPVITAEDSGGPLEFVKDRQNGRVLTSLEAEILGPALEELVRDTDKCRAWGDAGYTLVKDIGWERVIDTLLGQKKT
jgi:glycosyltransferase involved in cell wall biosynthesis